MLRPRDEPEGSEAAPVVGLTRLVLENARVLADPWAAPAEAVAFAAGRVLAVGSRAEVAARVGRSVRRIDCGGSVVLPGLVDPHLHLYALAARDAHLDLRGAGSPAAVLAAVAAAAATQPVGTWIRGEGLDEQPRGVLPTAADLDRAAPRHPVRLRHRSRHASLLSGRALKMLRAQRVALVDHDGLVAGDEQRISGAVGPLPAAAFAAGLAAAGERLLGLGLTTVADATPRTRRALAPLVRTAGAAHFLPRVHAMRPPGAARWPAIGRVAPGPVKIVVEDGPGGLDPAPAVLAARIARAARAGDRVAVHCVSAATLVAALAGFAALPPQLRRSGHRLEHVAECPWPLVREIARLGLTVVTNPAFVYWRGDVYATETPRARHGWLYRARSLRAAGVPLAAASDAPVVPCDPWRTMAAARTRRSASGRALGLAERLDARTALGLCTTGAADALGARALGRLVAGAAGDAVVVRGDPLRLGADDVAAMRPWLTVVAGEVAWQA